MNAPANPCSGCGAELLCLRPGSDVPIRFHGGGVTVQQMGPLRVQDVVPQHSHAYEHLTLLTHGIVQVHADGRFLATHTAPAAIVIPAGIKHLFVAMADDTLLFCIHRTDTTGEIPVLEQHRIKELG